MAAASHGGNRRLSVRVQKQLVPGVMSLFSSSHLIGETETRLLFLWRNLVLDVELAHHTAQGGSPRLWAKQERAIAARFRALNKLLIKIGILLNNDCFSPEELDTLDDLKDAIEQFSVLFVRTQRGTLGFRFARFKALLDAMRAAADPLLARHVGGRTKRSLADLFDYFSSRHFLEAAFDQSQASSAAKVADFLGDMLCIF